MEIKKTIKTDQGTIVFSGELTQEELDFVLTVGLNELLLQGALPFKHINSEDFSLSQLNIQSIEKQ